MNDPRPEPEGESDLVRFLLSEPVRRFLSVADGIEASLGAGVHVPSCECSEQQRDPRCVASADS